MMVTRMPMLALMASLALMIMVRTANGDELGSGVTSSSSEETSTPTMTTTTTTATTTTEQTLTSNTVGSITAEKQQPSSTSREGLQVEEVAEGEKEGEKEEGKKEGQEEGEREEEREVKEPLLEEGKKEEEEKHEEGKKEEEEAKDGEEIEKGEMEEDMGADNEKEEEKDVKGPVEEGKREEKAEEERDQKEEEKGKTGRDEEEKKEEEQGDRDKEEKEGEEGEKKEEKEEEMKAEKKEEEEVKDQKEEDGSKKEEKGVDEAPKNGKNEDEDKTEQGAVKGQDEEERKEKEENKKEEEEEGKKEPDEEEKRVKEGNEEENIKGEKKEEAESKEKNKDEGKKDEEEKEEGKKEEEEEGKKEQDEKEKKEEAEGRKEEEEGTVQHQHHQDEGKTGENTSVRLDDQTFEELATSAEPERASAEPEAVTESAKTVGPEMLAATIAEPEIVTESAKMTQPVETTTSVKPEMVAEGAEPTKTEELEPRMLAKSAEHGRGGQDTITTTTATITTENVPLVRPVNDGLDHHAQEQEEPNPFASIEAEHFAWKKDEKEEEEGPERTRMEEIKARSGEKEGEMRTRTEEEKEEVKNEEGKKEEGIGTGSSENGKVGIQNDDKKEEIGTGRSEKEEEIGTGRSEKEEELGTRTDEKEEKVTNEQGKKEEEIGSGRSEKEEETMIERTRMEEIKAISGENKEEVETRTDDKEEEHKTGMSEKEEEEFGIRRDEKEEVVEATTAMALPAEEADVPGITTSVIMASTPSISEIRTDEKEEIDVPRKDEKEEVDETRMDMTTAMAPPAEEEDIPGTTTSGAIISASSVAETRTDEKEEVGEIRTDEKEEMGEIRTNEKEEATGGITEPPTTMAMPENDAPEVTTASTPTLVQTTLLPSDEEKGAFRQEEEQEQPVRQITKMPMRPVEEAEQRELALSRAFRTPFLVHLDKIVWRLEFADLSSGPAKKLLDQIHRDLRSAFGTAIGPDFLDYQVEALLKGSVIVEGQLLTREPVDDPQSTAMALEQAILSGGGELGGNSVDTDAISIAGIRANSPSGNIVAANTQRQTEAAVNTGYIIGGAVTVGVLIIIFTIFAIVVFGVNNRRNNGTLKLKEEICMVENGKGGKFGDTPKRFMNMTNNDDGGVNLTGMRTTRLADGPRPAYGINIQQPVLLISDRPPVITLTSGDQ